MVRHIAISLALLLIAGCQSSAPITRAPAAGQGGAAYPAQSSSAKPADDAAPARQSTAQPNAAVIALLDKAQRQQETLDYTAAAASLERAIRIAPKDANLYFRLAGVRFEQGSLGQAGQLCRKAVSLADDSRYMELKCEALLE